MITITGEEWIADLGTMTCKNISNNIVIVFIKNGGILEGKLKYIPMELLDYWTETPHGERLIQKAVIDAQEVFLRAYFESNIK